MASYHTISLLPVIFYILPSFADCFLDLFCNSSVTGIFNKDTKLLCALTSQEEWNLTDIVLVKQGENVKVFNFKKSVNEVQGRIKLLHPASQDISLVIQNTQLSDNGIYQYQLQTTVGHKNADINLKVKAPYNMTVFPNIVSSRIVSVTCEATGYPLGQMHWFLNTKTNLTSNTNTSIEETPQGLYKISNTLPTKEKIETSEGVYTCAMWSIEDSKYEVKENISFSHPNSTSTEISGKERKKAFVIVPVIMALLFVALVISAVLQFRRRSHQVH
ncbi:programmed cell death 1 ligand 2-like isoform X2 [Rhincodon typus]|uniref:programmed cell death 1 ligand 2-like isoform X2 n=1 Tax=Rhincodon typus TaxID=259920 RepID=UPI0020300188|nr:programmed cell death 1 ligand 2-like isoform X2 [Rhincodon typus]